MLLIVFSINILSRGRMFQISLEERVEVVHAIQMYGFTLLLIFADFVPEKHKIQSFYYHRNRTHFM